MKEFDIWLKGNYSIMLKVKALNKELALNDAEIIAFNDVSLGNLKHIEIIDCEEITAKEN